MKGGEKAIGKEGSNWTNQGETGKENFLDTGKRYENGA